MAEFVCWCFEHTAEDIRSDARMHGRSLVLEKILAARKAGASLASDRPTPASTRSIIEAS